MMCKSFLTLLASLTLLACRHHGTGRFPANAECSTLGDKVTAQHQLYEKTRQQWLQRNVIESNPMLRDEWEQSLQPISGCELSTKDIAALKAGQDKQAELSRIKSEEISKSQFQIDLIQLRNDEPKLRKFCAQFPKGAILHQHANGTMNRETARKLLEQINPPIQGSFILEKSKDPNIELFPDEQNWIEELAAQPARPFLELSVQDRTRLIDLFFLPTEKSFDHSFKRFSFPFLIFPILRDKQKPHLDPDYLQLVDFLKRSYSLGIRYVELTKGFRFDPKDLVKLHETAEALYKETGVIVRWNYAFFRNASAAKNAEQAKALLKSLEAHPSQEIVGIDLLANEEKDPALEAGQQSYAPVVAAALGQHPNFTTKLRRTFHAGELGRLDNVRDALIMGAERVGHGVLMDHDPVTLEYARKISLGVEVNPVSNLRLRVVKQLKDHPFLKFLRLGLKVSLSTDDEGVLETDMNNECVLVIQQTDVNYVEMKEMVYNSIDSSFATVAQKLELRKWLDQSFEEFERIW